MPKSVDYATALREFKRLAKQGLAPAQYNLGLMYANGRGVPQDYKTAVESYRLAAELGNDINAQVNLYVQQDEKVWGLPIPKKCQQFYSFIDLSYLEPLRGGDRYDKHKNIVSVRTSSTFFFLRVANTAHLFPLEGLACVVSKLPPYNYVCSGDSCGYFYVFGAQFLFALLDT